MSGSSSIFRFRKNVTIGALAAEEDTVFLRECFIDTGLLDQLLSRDDFRRVILGRTGTGKSALFFELAQRVDTLIINPDELALNHLSNSELLKELDECGINLSPFYKLLWKHVFVVEVLRFRHEQLREGNDAAGFWKRLLGSLTGNSQDRTSKEALEYITSIGDKFWLTTEYRVKEVTERVEQQIRAEIGAKLGAASFSTGGAQGFSQENKAVIAEIGRQFVEAIQIKKLNDAVRWLAADMEAQPPLFIIIDGLDGDWAATALQHHLIRALIDTAREFKTVTNVKILIALREDLFESILYSVSDSGAQREKYTQLCLQIQWSKDELIRLVEVRVNKLVKDAYTSAKVRIDDVMEQIGGQSGIQYLLERTLLRPRDAIAFFNYCIAQAGDNPKITRRMVLEAEPSYSVARLQALADEWREIEPVVVEVAKLINGRKANFRLDEIPETDIEAFCESLYITYWHAGSQICEAAKRYSEEPCEATSKTVRRLIVNLLYKVGIIGVKPLPTEPMCWSFEGPPAIDHLDLDPHTGARVHKAFWRALSIVGTSVES